MLLFAILMISAAGFMLKPTNAPKTGIPKYLAAKRLLGSAGVGFLSGMVGAGGGFLMIPALIALFQLPLKVAIGTSLSIITLNTLLGLSGELALGQTLDWVFVGYFMSFTLMGVGLGVALNQRVNSVYLKHGFGLFTLAIGCSILYQTLKQLMI